MMENNKIMYHTLHSANNDRYEKKVENDMLNIYPL